MAAGTNTQGAKSPSAGEEELSMEEILQSIRRIIAEDDKDDKKAVPAEAANGAKPTTEEAVMGSDVLELTEMVKDDGSIVSLNSDGKPAEAAKESSSDVLNKIDEALTPEKKAEMPIAKPEEKPAPAPTPSQSDIDAMFAEPPPPAPAKAEPAIDPDSLLSSEASMAAASSIKKLKSAEPEPPPLVTTPAPNFISGNTVEGMVADMLRPMMKSWLDANLPQIVERIVEREVKKLTKYLTDKGE